jgi:hypothetical protein
VNRKILFFLACSFWSIFLIAQEPISIQLTEKDGLLDKEFYSLVEDSKGIVWLAGNRGLVKFDGKNFKNISHPDQRGLSVFSPVVDSMDRVWCVNISGQLMYVENGEMHIAADLKSELIGNLPTLHTLNNTLIVGHHQSIIVFENAIRTETIPYDKPNIYVQPAIIDNQLIISLNNEIVPLSTRESKPSIFSLKSSLLDETYKLKARTFIYESGDHTLLFQINSSLQKRFLIRVLNEWIPIKIPVEIEDLNLSIQVIDNQLFLLSNEGVFVAEIIDDELKIKSHFLHGKYITGIILDQDLNYWLTTLNSGVFIIPNLNIIKINGTDDNFKASLARAIHSEEILIGSTQGDVLLYNVKSRAGKLLNNTDDMAVSEIVVDPYRDQINVFKSVKNYTYDLKTSELLDSAANIVSVMKRGILINEDEILYASSSSASWASYPFTKSISIDMSARFTKRGYTVAYDKINQIKYLALVDQLVAIDKNGIEKVIKDSKGDDLFTDSMVVDDQGNLWIATFTDGLLLYKEGKIKKHWTVENGLLDNRISCIAFQENILWIATASGIQAMDISTGKFKNLLKEDGIPNYAVNSIVPMDEEVFFSTKEVVFGINKCNAFKEFTPLDVTITQIHINNEKAVLRNNYVIQSNQSNITINFNAAGYRSLAAGKYAYRLKGNDDEWKSVSPGLDIIQFASLPVGNFIFQLKALNAGGGEEPVSQFGIEVVEPFYLSVWFYLLILGNVSGVIVLYYRRQLRFRESEKNKALSKLQRDKEFINLKLENLRSQMNPHFVFNALNSIQDYIVRNDKNLASDYLGKFADLIRTYLDHSTMSEISLEEEINTLEMYLELEKLRFEERLNYQIELDQNIQPSAIQIPTMLIQPYVENSLKHGLLHRKTDRRLHIYFELMEQEKLICCKIIDNGVGREKSAEINNRNTLKRQSFATNATENRLQLLNYGKAKEIGVEILDLIENGVPTGTEVRVKIPYKINK